MLKSPSLSTIKVSEWDEKARTWMEAADFRWLEEGSNTNAPSGCTTTRAADKIIDMGIDAHRSANMEACKRAGRTGRFYTHVRAKWFRSGG